MPMKHSERGQTIPFWAFASALVLGLVFFSINYGNTLAQQVRAQNAADTYAAAGVAPNANMDNEFNTLLYAAAVDELRMRYLIQAMLNTINNPASCGASCDSDYQSLLNAYQTAATNYSTINQVIQQANNLTQGGQKNGPWKTQKLISGNCSMFDCTYTYTTNYDSTTGAVDVVACKNVAVIAAPSIGLAGGKQFQVIGRSASVETPIFENFNPGATNPNTGGPYQPNESPAGTNQSTDFIVDFSKMNVNLAWFVSGPIKPGSWTGASGC